MSSSDLVPDVKVEYAGAVVALERFERQGVAAMDHAMHGIANAAAQGAKGRGGGKYGAIQVQRAGAGEYAVVAMQQDGRHIANYHNYGTLASRKPKAKQPGTRADHSKPGIKRKRFLRKPPKKVIVEIMLEAVVVAGRASGLEMRKGV